MNNQKNSANHLIDEKSPYLLQHAYNPVDWYPWGGKSLAKAKKEGKLILLSIGYSTCHWCHVMAEESFENPEIAAIMNRYFVCIKVDREERPDLDKIYMTAVISLTGAGGWPLNVFLTPDLKPFFGGTYFPPESRAGIMAWPEVLTRIGNAWSDPSMRRQISLTGDELTLNLQKNLSWQAEIGEVDLSMPERAYSAFVSSFDQKMGGFSPAPKFPSPVNQNFLLTYHTYGKIGKKDPEQSQKALDMALFTLRKMAENGIYDQIGGGFHRYSVDGKWHVPHFEKMLYDNSQLIMNYLEAYRITGDDFFRSTAEETIEYVLRDMIDVDQGGFYSAEDADSLTEEPLRSGNKDKGHGKKEGAFYVWGSGEIEALLGKEQSNIIDYHYGIRPEGNVEHDPGNEFKGQNILFAAHTISETADKFDKTPEEIRQSIEKAKTLLLNVREKRVRPHRDEKIITGWNGLMISALARAYQLLEKSEYIKAAGRAAGFIKTHLYEEATGTLYRRWCQGERMVPGLAGDYANLIQGLIDLYESDFDPEWLNWAIELSENLIDLFYDDKTGGFFMTRSDHDEHLIARVKEDADSVLPSAASIAVLSLIRLYGMTNRKLFYDVVERSMKTVLARASQHPASVPQMLVGLMVMQSELVKITLTGGFGKKNGRQMLKLLYFADIPARSIVCVD
ncbi:MAG: thioredoxin domain-containing protein, partial [Deltaproteobacteria bacterium]|nr:thioredoxin domain-containing protein [Deltaproteobacteria bacterium]